VSGKNGSATAQWDGGGRTARGQEEGRIIVGGTNPIGVEQRNQQPGNNSKRAAIPRGGKGGQTQEELNAQTEKKNGAIMG